MLWTVLLVAALGSDPIASALEAYAGVQGYRVTLRSTLRDGEAQVVRYHYRSPGFVRMDFVEPHGGALLVYDPLRQEASLRPFGAGTIPRLKLGPRNRLIRSPSGHTVDQSDAGALLRNARQLQARGSTSIAGEERVGRKRAVHVVVTGAVGEAVGDVHRYDLWLHKGTLFPLKAESRDAEDRLVESVSMEDVELDPVFPDGFFDG